MAARTVRDFQVGLDIGPIVDAWAQSNHYGFRGMSPDGTRNYQRGNGILTGAMPLTIRQYGPAVHLEGWIHATLVAREGRSSTVDGPRRRQQAARATRSAAHRVVVDWFAPIEWLPAIEGGATAATFEPR